MFHVRARRENRSRRRNPVSCFLRTLSVLLCVSVVKKKLTTETQRKTEKDGERQMKRTVIVALTLIAAVAAFAEDGPKPNPKLKELQPFVGEYHCKGTAFASEWGPE